MIRAVLTSLTLALLSFTSPNAPKAGISTFTSHAFKERVALKENVHAVASKTAAVTFAEKQMAFDDYALEVYNDASLKKAGLSFDVFQKAFVGYHNFRQQELIDPANTILTVIDFSKPSREKRLWIVDLQTKKLLYNTLVAHGRNTGQDKATKFSNKPNSYMSSIGFYLTDKTYFGKHGLSLRLNGMDAKYNSNAMARAIVVHGADYVSEAFVKQYGRLGRSLGCPAVPEEVSKEVINLIKDNSCLYINGSDNSYTSNFLNTASAVEAFAMEAVNLPQQI
ncbi:murein L,D-transpeptidase catalytic domain family protein [Pontibacter sp. 172403-2]|uniref:murein L,D-transpeptidase catalytic domain family protein n=1 Tax=Pontibacter rufus TaxID=2791028 RepID=UPI0018AF7B69|nr:murein L,D-transpeptidase catalytic domain family protein [Pontibacter sp. 172403-2]MBF9254763.1 murein L,D-transpeptidase catalytic domain family protein [Pontibacter sp. 172403-2]